MKFIKKIKSNKGVSLADVAAAIIIISMLAATVANMFHQIYLNISKVRLNAIALNSAVRILEDTDRLAYEDVDNDLLTENDYNIPENIEVVINVENYNEQYPEKQDLIKIVTLTINYTLYDSTEEIVFKKLKIKEI